MTESVSARRDGHDWGSNTNFDVVGTFYLALAILYTIFIISALSALFLLRKTHAVRIRNFSVICATVLTLHVYLMLILLVYPLNGLFKCGWEFWIMSILLPLGMALFQASNIRLYSYAKEQKAIAEGRFQRTKKYHFKLSDPCPCEWFKSLTVEKKTYVAIGIGMLVQLAVTIIIFFGSRKFHASYGFFSEHVDADHCRRGPEWIPSVFWQFLWATVFGPFVLLRIRRIRDTHYWAWQTRLAVIACLPGTPLWLAFIYARGQIFDTVNHWFVPSGWFLPGLMTMQLVSIFFPLLDVYKLKSLERKFGGNRDIQGTTGNHEKAINPYSMATLELQLSKNPHHLLYWAYTKEFTAENILFLTAVRDFKRRWEQLAKHVENLSLVQLRERYEEAAVIYFKLVNPFTAKMNINVDSRTYNELEQMFKGVEYQPDDNSSTSGDSSCYTESNVVTPWDDCAPRPASTSPRQSGEGKLIKNHVDKLYPLPVTEIYDRSDASLCGALKEIKEPTVPATFTLEIFDRAYETVKNDVYLNTWVRYEAQYSRPRSPTQASRGHPVSFVGRFI